MQGLSAWHQACWHLHGFDRCTGLPKKTMDMLLDSLILTFYGKFPHTTHTHTQRLFFHNVLIIDNCTDICLIKEIVFALPDFWRLYE